MRSAIASYDAILTMNMILCLDFFFAASHCMHSFFSFKAKAHTNIIYLHIQRNTLPMYECGERALKYAIFGRFYLLYCYMCVTNGGGGAREVNKRIGRASEENEN